MKKYLVTIITVVLLLVSYSLNFYMLGYSTKQLQYKKEILELTEKRNSSSSLALQTVYQDSINNAVKSWLEDETIK